MITALSIVSAVLGIIAAWFFGRARGAAIGRAIATEEAAGAARMKAAEIQATVTEIERRAGGVETARIAEIKREARTALGAPGSDRLDELLEETRRMKKVLGL